jgi:hypothetical protein
VTEVQKSRVSAQGACRRAYLGRGKCFEAEVPLVRFYDRLICGSQLDGRYQRGFVLLLQHNAGAEGQFPGQSFLRFVVPKEGISLSTSKVATCTSMRIHLYLNLTTRISKELGRLHVFLCSVSEVQKGRSLFKLSCSRLYQRGEKPVRKQKCDPYYKEPSISHVCNCNMQGI